MAFLIVCGACGLHVRVGEPHCPYCDAPSLARPTTAALLLGLSLAACGGGDVAAPGSASGSASDASTGGTTQPAWPSSETCVLQPSYGGPCTNGWPPDGGYETTGPVDPSETDPSTTDASTTESSAASTTSGTATDTDTDTDPGSSATTGATDTDTHGGCTDPPCVP